MQLLCLLLKLMSIILYHSHTMVLYQRINREPLRLLRNIIKLFQSTNNHILMQWSKRVFCKPLYYKYATQHVTPYNYVN